MPLPLTSIIESRRLEKEEEKIAREKMLHNDMMVGAFSHSTGVGKLWQELPDAPSDACLMFAWYTVDEEETVCHYYLRYFQIKVLSSDSFSISWHGRQSHVFPVILCSLLHLLMQFLMPEMIYKKSCHLCSSTPLTHCCITVLCLMELLGANCYLVKYLRFSLCIRTVNRFWL